MSKGNFSRKQEALHKNFTKQFNAIIDPFRYDDHASSKFKKIFPEPKPRGDNMEQFEKLYEIYEEWIGKQFGDGDGSDNEWNKDDLLKDESSMGDQSSLQSKSVGSGLQSSLGVGDDPKPPPKTDITKVEAIAEGNEEEKEE